MVMGNDKMIELRYEDVEWYWVVGKYDIAWWGYVYHNNILHEAQTYDDTDYDAMTALCPCCSKDGDNWKDCICENYKDVYVYLTPLSLFERIAVYIKKWYWDNVERKYLFWKRRKSLK
jgi:hypothetical protein